MPRQARSHTSRAKARFKTALGAERLEQMARATGFVSRRRLVTGDSVFWALMVSVGAHCTQYISDVLRTLNKQQRWSLRYKPFWNRLAKAAFPRFMKAMFQLLARDLVGEVFRAEANSDLSFFSDVFIDDGSSMSVASGLRRIFPGRFTHTDPAAVELHAHMSLLKDQIVSVAVAPDREGERQFLPPAHTLPRRSLSLRDRGYVDLDYFEQLESREAYLIVRARGDLNPVVEEIHHVPRRVAKRWQGKKLSQLPRSLLRDGADLLVSWRRTGRDPLRLRLAICRHVSKRTSKKRLTRRKQRYQRKNTWIILIHNLPERFVAATALRLYRLRWQVELSFKDWKSYANLHALQSEHPSIVEGFLWASLCAALIKRALAHWAQLVGDRPISTRIAAQSGPHILPDFVAWITGAAVDDAFAGVLSFLMHNARRTHPEREHRRPHHILGLRALTQVLA